MDAIKECNSYKTKLAKIKIKNTKFGKKWHKENIETNFIRPYI